MVTSRRDPAAAEGPERAHRARDDPRRRADLAGGDLAPGRDLEADGLARAAVAARGGARARDGAGSGPAHATAPSFFESVPEAGARARARPRRALPARRDLRPARRRPRAAGRRARRGRRRGRDRGDRRVSALALAASSGLAGASVDGAVVGVPGVVDADTGRLTLATNVPGLEGRDLGGDLQTTARAPRHGRERHQPRRPRRAVARRRARRRRLRLPLGRHRARCGARPARRAAPRPSRRRRRGRPRRCGPRRRHRSLCRPPSPRSPRGSWATNGRSTMLRPPYDARERLRGRPRRRRRSRARSSTRRRGGSRFTSRRSPRSPTSTLVVLGGGIGANGDLLLDADPRVSSARWLPYPAADRGLEPRRRSGADRRARGRPALGARQRVREPRPRGPHVSYSALDRAQMLISLSVA